MVQFSQTEFPVLILLILLLKKQKNIGTKVSALPPSRPLFTATALQMCSYSSHSLRGAITP